MMWLLLHAGDAGTAHWRLPPLHPILVNFTAALVPVSVLSDVLGRFLRRESLTATGWWTLLFAAAVTPFTAMAGWLWLRSMGGMDMRQMNVHKWLGTSLSVVLILLVCWRGLLYRRSRTPGWGYLAASLLVVGALVYQGDLGGSMSFGGGESDAADMSQAGHNAPAAHAESETADPPDTATTAPAGPSRLREGWHDHIEVP